MKLKITFLTLLFLFSTGLVAQSTPATKDDIKMILREMDKRFEQVDKRFEDMNNRFEDMYDVMLFGFGLLVTASGVLFLRSESNTRLLLKEISDHKTETKVKLLEQKQNKIDVNQLISVLENLNNKDKIKIKELLHI